MNLEGTFGRRTKASNPSSPVSHSRLVSGSGIGTGLPIRPPTSWVPLSGLALAPAAKPPRCAREWEIVPEELMLVPAAAAIVPPCS